VQGKERMVGGVTVVTASATALSEGGFSSFSAAGTSSSSTEASLTSSSTSYTRHRLLGLQSSPKTLQKHSKLLERSGNCSPGSDFASPLASESAENSQKGREQVVDAITGRSESEDGGWAGTKRGRAPPALEDMVDSTTSRANTHSRVHNTNGPRVTQFSSVWAHGGEEGEE